LGIQPTSLTSDASGETDPQRLADFAKKQRECVAFKLYTSLMKISARISVVIFLLTALSLGQDHAPTVQQCEADQRLWWEQLDTQPEEISKLSFRKLNQRSGEMADCAVIDEEHINAYNRTSVLLLIQQSSRLANFVVRHNLMSQFLAEDKVGKR
jgi:hypothetical protein